MKDRVFWYTQAKGRRRLSINAQIYTRAQCRDYDAWEKEERSRRLGYRDVLPYFNAPKTTALRQRLSHGDQPLGVSNRFRAAICEGLFPRRPGDGIPFIRTSTRQPGGVGLYQFDPERRPALLGFGRYLRRSRTARI